MGVLDGACVPTTAGEEVRELPGEGLARERGFPAHERRRRLDEFRQGTGDRGGIARRRDLMRDAALSEHPAEITIALPQCQDRAPGANVLVELRRDADPAARAIEQQ